MNAFPFFGLGFKIKMFSLKKQPTIADVSNSCVEIAKYLSHVKKKKRQSYLYSSLSLNLSSDCARFVINVSYRV